jgi:MYXO-CTERM domain-containing protein
VSYPAATASDDRGLASVEYSHPSGSRFPVGTTVVTVTATDTSSNRQQCSFEVSVAAPPEPPEPPKPPEAPAEGCACRATTGSAGSGMLWLLIMLTASLRAFRRGR